MKTVLAESISLKGIVRLRSHAAGTVQKLQALHAAGRHSEADELFRSGKLEAENRNLIMTAPNLGRDLLVQWLMGNATYPIGIAWGAIGTGATTPTSGDTQLTAETNRTSPSFMQDSGFNEASFQFFFPDANVVNQTYYECGSFVGGSSTPNTGQMFNHALFTTPYAKVAGVDVTLEIDITFS